VGFTVPDIEVATQFFVDVIGCTLVFEIRPFQSDDDRMQALLGVDPRSVIRSLLSVISGLYAEKAAGAARQD